MPESVMGSRNKQRATFEKRQRELARKERQAAKRARRHGNPDTPAEQPSAAAPPEGAEPGRA
jgi:hypothetical protein